ncbi:hypothetical protein GIB67_008835 [Kingdonia uniflora]|uniref:Uncharacterized protein n=1 Tax=Kingdonia uniflora TaxID=39325 RepID=A0A7J7LVE1_9MAGN|nr:hypothetical protein GIB67_008835 [Kingdonia uniflora]
MLSHILFHCVSESEKCNTVSKNGMDALKNKDGKQITSPVSKTFVGTEIVDGRQVNVVEGLRLYEELIDNSETAKIVTLANEMRVAGRRGQLQGKFNCLLFFPYSQIITIGIDEVVPAIQQWIIPAPDSNCKALVVGFDSNCKALVVGFPLPDRLVYLFCASIKFEWSVSIYIYNLQSLSTGQAFVLLKRPMKGHGREMIQLGPPIADAPLEDEETAGISKGTFLIEAIPELLQDVVARLVQSKVMAVKPDSCIIDFFNEGDYSHAHMFPYWYGRPVCILFLTECDITLGREIVADRPGDYRGTLKLSLSAGSLLSLQGKSADFAKHALPSLRKQRIIVTFTKSQPKRFVPSDSPRLPLWGPPPNPRPMTHHFRHPGGPKHYGAVPMVPINGGVLPPPPSIRSQHLPPPNEMSPMFVTTTTQVPPVVPLPPAQPGWVAIPPPRLPLPGTGVFLPPPGSSNQSLPPSTATENEVWETQGPLENEPSLEKPDNTSSGTGKDGNSDGQVKTQSCNGSLNGGWVVVTDEQVTGNIKKKLGIKPT